MNEMLPSTFQFTPSKQGCDGAASESMATPPTSTKCDPDTTVGNKRAASPRKGHCTTCQGFGHYAKTCGKKQKASSPSLCSPSLASRSERDDKPPAAQIDDSRPGSASTCTPRRPTIISVKAGLAVSVASGRDGARWDAKVSKIVTRDREDPGSSTALVRFDGFDESEDEVVPFWSMAVIASPMDHCSDMPLHCIGYPVMLFVNDQWRDGVVLACTPAHQRCALTADCQCWFVVNYRDEHDQLHTVRVEAGTAVDRICPRPLDARIEGEAPLNWGHVDSELAACAVCEETDGVDSDPLVFCDGCNSICHRTCWGATERELEADQYYCTACAANSASSSPPPPSSSTVVPAALVRRCSVCPVTVTGGPLMPNDDGIQWTHTLCALFVPELRLGDPKRMAPVMGHGNISVQRRSLVCAICRINDHDHANVVNDTNAPAQCSHGMCQVPMHPTCARAAGWQVDLRNDGHAQMFCPAHRRDGGSKLVDAALGIGASSKRQRSGSSASGAGGTRPSIAVTQKEEASASAERSRYLLSIWDHVSPLLGPKLASTDGTLYRTLTRDASTCRAPNAKRGRAVQCQPESIVGGEMRDYQLQGLQWMVQRHDEGAGGILGDEMGLGKTLQVISFLAFLKNDRGVAGPHLIVAPMSVLNTWIDEFKRWAPSMSASVLHGDRQRCKERIAADTPDVVLTTYEMVRCEIGWLRRMRWRYVIMDEAQRIKNNESLAGKAAAGLHCTGRFLLTGTPLQNNLHELWALLSWLYPEVFMNDDSAQVFNGSGGSGWSNHRIDVEKDQDLLLHAKGILGAVMMRRLKCDLNLSIPPKTEIKLMTGLSELQVLWYKRLLSVEAKMLLGVAAGGTEATKWTRLQSLLMQLRKCCNHPYLFPGAEKPPYVTDERIVNDSSKMRLLDQILTRSKQQGRKVLVFSQFTQMLDILEDFVRLRGWKFLRLDGTTSLARRRYEISQFQQPSAPHLLYLISTRAGSLGVTLTAADTVVLYDSDWNPTIDRQAMDRTHRIGQSKPVTVYRLVTQGTVEDRVLQVAQRKQLINAVVMRDGVTGEAQRDDRDDDGDVAMSERGQGRSGANQAGLSESGLSIEQVARMVLASVHSVASMSQNADETLDEAIERSLGGGNATNNGNDQAQSKGKGRGKGKEPAAGDGGGATLTADGDPCGATDEEMQQGANALKLFSCEMKSIREFGGEKFENKTSTLRDRDGNKITSKPAMALADAWCLQNAVDGPRERRSTVVRTQGQDVLRWSIEEEARAVSAEVERKKMKELELKVKERNKWKHNDHCLVCRQQIEGFNKPFTQEEKKTHGTKACEIRAARGHQVCSRCPVAMHIKCAPHGSLMRAVNSINPGALTCSGHKCNACGDSVTQAGGLMFRCCACPSAFCQECLEFGFEAVDTETCFAGLGFTFGRGYAGIRCAQCVQNKVPLHISHEQDEDDSDGNGGSGAGGRDGVDLTWLPETTSDKTPVLGRIVSWDGIVDALITRMPMCIGHGVAPPSGAEAASAEDPPDVSVPVDPHVSTKSLQLTMKGLDTVVKVIGTWGVMVDNNVVEPGQECIVKNGSDICLGRFRLRILLTDAARARRLVVGSTAATEAAGLSAAHSFDPELTARAKAGAAVTSSMRKLENVKGIRMPRTPRTYFLTVQRPIVQKENPRKSCPQILALLNKMFVGLSIKEARRFFEMAKNDWTRWSVEMSERGYHNCVRTDAENRIMAIADGATDGMDCGNMDDGGDDEADGDSC